MKKIRRNEGANEKNKKEQKERKKQRNENLSNSNVIQMMCSFQKVLRVITNLDQKHVTVF